MILLRSGVTVLVIMSASLVLTAGHNALRSPVNSTHSMMLWHMWVVLIAGSTALHYVLFVLPTVTSHRMPGVTSSMPRARLVLCSVHPWP